MKNILKFLLLGLLFISCEDFLDEEPVAFRTPIDFFETEAEINQGLAAVYNTHRSIYNGAGLQLLFGESRSDNTNIEIVNDGALASKELNEFTMNSTNINISSYWNTHYVGVTRINFVLASIEDASFNNPDTKNSRKGEGLFLRSLFYFNLVRIFGDVPYIVRPGESPEQILSEEFIERDPEAEVYAGILSDAQEAINLLPETTDDPGRATKGAALMLKAKIHMALGEYAEARPLLEQINTLGYSLLNNYAAVFFTRNHAEGIFEIQYSTNGVNQGANFFSSFVPSVSGQDILGPGANPNANGNQYQPTQELIDLYDDDDVRKAHNISTYIDDNTGIEYQWGSKFAFPFVGDGLNQQNINWQMFRYADALLMLAECYEKVGGGDPTTIIEQIRTRAGLADPSLSPSELADMEQTIADERRRELAFEGHRYFDLLRTGKLVEVMTAHGVQQVSDGLTETVGAYQNIRTIFGIPDAEVLEFGMEQTQGWE